ncbi:MAG: hypothetical protein QM758_22770 [Armatimonas sp.]
MKLPRILLLTLAALWLTGSAFAQTRYRNLVNEKFATVSSGPQSAVIVDVSKSATPAQIDTAVETRLKQLWKSSSRSVKQATRGRAQNVKRTTYPMSTVVAVRQDGKLVLKAPTRQVGGGTLNFVFSNFQGKQVIANNGSPVVIEDFLRTLLLGDGQREGLYNKIVRLYGQPSWSGTVEVRSMGFYDDGEATDPQRVLFGAYDVSNARIMLPLYETVDSTAHAFLLGLLHAFHGPAVFQYDTWEQGFIRAAAAVIARDTQLGFLDPSNTFLYTNLYRYDLLNQPALAGPRFVPPSQENVAYEGLIGIYKMLWARMSMSGSAWLKCYIENPNFFKDFNAAYYAQFSPGVTPSLAGNVPQLKAIAASVLPNVEGMPFEDWFARQYVFDTAVTPGTKLFTFPYSLKSETTGDGVRHDLSFGLVYYRSSYDTASGKDDEILLGGRGYALYTDAIGQRFPTGGPQGDSALLEAGEGFLTATFLTGPGNSIGRLTADFSVGSETARVYIPVGVTGDVRGVGLGSTQGAIRVEQATILPGGNNRVQSTTIADKAFGVKFGGAGNELFQTLFVIDDGGIVRTYRKNLGDIAPGDTTVGEDLSAMVVLPAPGSGGVQTVSHDFAANTNGAPYLVSFPVRPLASSVEQSIGLPASDFLITGFDTGSGSYATLTPGQPSAPALAPGRGFWFKYAPASGTPSTRITLTGVAPSTDTDFPIAARYGWNLIGSPFDTDVALANVRVRLQDRDPLSWEEAVAANLVLAEAFDFDAQAGYRSATTLQGNQWRGYWVRVLAPSGVTLLLPGPDVGRKVAVPSRATSTNSANIWAVKLIAQQQAQNLPFGGVATGSFGAKEGATRSVDARDSQSPPDIMEALTVSFGDGALPGGGRLIGDFRDRKSAAQGTWTVQLKSPQSGVTRLRWEGLSGVPRNVRLTLIDGDKRISLSQSSGYSVTLEAGKTRTLKITAEAASLNPLRIMAVSTTTRSAGQGGIGIRYSVSNDAEILAEVTTMGGRSVAHLSGGRSRANEQGNLRWNGRSEAGAALPAGAYLLTLTARGENGETARLTRPVMVIR